MDCVCKPSRFTMQGFAYLLGQLGCFLDKSHMVLKVSCLLDFVDA